MLVDRAIFPITTLGPGERLVIWFSGCSKQCRNCSNPELWFADQTKNIEPDILFQTLTPYLKQQKLAGITLTGGDPLEQTEDLIEILPRLRMITNDILLYTGYVYEDLPEILGSKLFCILKETVSVLIDGPYIEELNDSKSSLRGSTNQQIYFFDEKMVEKYRPYLAQGRRMQNVFYQDKMISVGIPRRCC